MNFNKSYFGLGTIVVAGSFGLNCGIEPSITRIETVEMKLNSGRSGKITVTQDGEVTGCTTLDYGNCIYSDGKAMLEELSESKPCCHIEHTPDGDEDVLTLVASSCDDTITETLFEVRVAGPIGGDENTFTSTDGSIIITREKSECLGTDEPPVDE